MNITHFVQCCIVALVVAVPAKAWAFQLRKPKTISVSVQGKNASVSTDNTRINGSFLEARIRADYSCDSGYIIREMRTRTPHARYVEDATNSRARTLANRLTPWQPIASVASLRRACSQGKSYVEVPVRLSSVCADTSKTSHAQAFKVPSASPKIRINLSCSGVIAPRYMPAKAYPSKYNHSCPGTPSGIEGNNEPTRIATSAFPLQCGGTFNANDPKFTRTKVYLAKHVCEPGWVIDRRARHQLKFDRSGAPVSASYGKVRWCHVRVDPGQYLTQTSTTQLGKIKVNLLGSTPNITAVKQAKFRFKPHVPPAPPGKPVCKRADFYLSDEANLLSVQSGGNSSCSTTYRTVTLGLGYKGAKEAARMACINEANRLKRTGGWNSLPAAGSGKRFTIERTVPLSLVGHYCYGGNTPSGSNWTYTVDCAEHPYQSEWNAVTSVGTTIECRAK